MTYDQWKTASPYDDEEEIGEDCENCEVHLDFCTCTSRCCGADINDQELCSECLEHI